MLLTHAWRFLFLRVKYEASLVILCLRQDCLTNLRLENFWNNSLVFSFFHWQYSLLMAMQVSWLDNEIRSVLKWLNESVPASWTWIRISGLSTSWAVCGGRTTQQGVHFSWNHLALSTCWLMPVRVWQVGRITLYFDPTYSNISCKLFMHLMKNNKEMCPEMCKHVTS